MHTSMLDLTVKKVMLSELDLCGSILKGWYPWLVKSNNFRVWKILLGYLIAVYMGTCIPFREVYDAWTKLALGLSKVWVHMVTEDKYYYM